MRIAVARRCFSAPKILHKSSHKSHEEDAFHITVDGLSALQVSQEQYERGGGIFLQLSIVCGLAKLIWKPSTSQKDTKYMARKKRGTQLYGIVTASLLALKNGRATRSIYFNKVGQNSI